MAQDARMNKTENNIAIYYHFIKKAEQGDIVLQYVPSEDNLANILTKGLGGQDNNKLSKLIGIDIDIGGASTEEEC